MSYPCFAADVLAAVGKLPDLVPTRAVAVRGGHSHACWGVATTTGDLLVKVPIRDPQPQRVARHATMHRAARTAGAPVAGLRGTFLHLVPPMLVFDWIDGTDARAAWPTLTDTQRQQIAFSLGQAVATLHAIDGEGFTGHPPEADWRQVAGARVAELAELHAEAGLLPSACVDDVADELERLAARVTAWVRPAFTHFDLHLPNVVVAGGRFAALLDCEHARWWDPVADLVKLRMWVFDPYPETAGPFQDGYTADGGHLHHLADRLALCQGLELLSGLLYWQRVGDRAMYEDYRHRLRAWLR